MPIIPRHTILPFNQQQRSMLNLRITRIIWQHQSTYLKSFAYPPNRDDMTTYHTYNFNLSWYEQSFPKITQLQYLSVIHRS